MNLKSIVEKGWNFTQDHISRAVSSPMDTGKTITLTAIATIMIGCPGKTPTEPDNPPYFTSSTPTAETTQTNIGNTHTVRGEAEDPDGDSIDYSTFKDDVKVNDTNEYTFTIDKKGMTKIQIIAYNALSDTLTKNFSANNQSPVANDIATTIDEESTKKIPESELGSDPDGDNLNYNVTSTSAGVDAQFKNGQLEITGQQDFFGNANVNYNVSDGEGTDNGIVSVTVNNTADNPNANAGNDKTGTINEEIQLDASASSHPDNPISTITEYVWRALNDEENINITNADQENANFTANTAGSYDIELTTTDNLEATDKDTMNISIDSYKIIINTTNVLNDENIEGLEIMLAGKTAFTNSAGQAELEYPTNASLSGNLEIQDENIVGEIGDFFNYSDTESMSINGDKEFYIEMVPNVEFESDYYTDIFDFLKSMTPNIYSLTTYTPGEHPEDYPILIDVKEADMPAEHYKRATDEAINLINQTLGWEVYKTTTGDDARYIFDYTESSGRFSPEQVEKDGVWYIDTATVYIWNNASVNSFEILKGVITHELVHGLGLAFHSLDPQDVSYTPVWDSDISTNEKNAAEVYLKFQGGTKLNNYQPE